MLLRAWPVVIITPSSDRAAQQPSGSVTPDYQLSSLIIVRRLVLNISAFMYYEGPDFQNSRDNKVDNKLASNSDICIRIEFGK